MNGQRKNGTGMRQSVHVNNQNQIQLQNAYTDGGQNATKSTKVNKRTSSLKDNVQSINNSQPKRLEPGQSDMQVSNK